MFSFQLKTVVRSIMQRKFYSFIGMVSLAIGLTVSMLILSFIRYESRFDTMHPDADRVYRFNWISSAGSHFATFFNPVSPVLETALPEIESVTRIAGNQRLFTIDGENQFRTLSMVDDSFFEFFNYQTLAGDPISAIRDMGSAVVTEAAAMELFGESRPLGRVFTVDQAHDFRVAAIVSNNPGNSHLVSNIYINIENLTTVWNSPNFWDNAGSDVMYHYARLAPGIDPLAVERNAEAFYSENIVPGSTARIVLQPMLDIHFNTDLQNEMSTRDDITGLVKGQRQRSDIFIFGGVAVLTLVIAAFNFMNLQAVQLSRRSREIGVKRIAGSSRVQLIAQFQMETLFIALAAFVISLILCELFMPLFDSLVASTVGAGSFFTGFNVVVLLIAALTVGLVAGAYPSITAARLSPSSVLHGDTVNNGAVSRFRSGLIVAQFSISIGLIVAAGIVNTQIQYAMTKSLGFNPENVVTVELPNLQSRIAYARMRDEISGLPGVVSVSSGSVIPTRDLSDGRTWVRDGGDPDNGLPTRWIRVYDDYFETLGMEFVAGRPLNDDFPSDRTVPWSQTVTSNSGGIVLNETAVRLGGWGSPAEAIGDRFVTEGQFRGLNYRNESTIVGVVADTHYQSVRSDIVPLSYTLEIGTNIMMVKLTEGNQAATLAQLDRIWQEQIPEYPIQRSFLADSYTAFYAGENRAFALFIGLSIVAITIACLGLYALASFVTERRTKEISIRKVLGATVRSIAGMLAWDFSKLVVVANVIAWPLAWWSMQQWLSNFAYRTEINLTIFLLAGLATFVLAMITTFQKTYSVASVNPVLALKTE